MALRWCGVNSILFGKQQLDQPPVSALVYNMPAQLHRVFQVVQGDDVMAERSYDEIEHELEAAFAQLQDHPPSTIEGLIHVVIHLEQLAQERTDMVLRDLLERMGRLERRMESLGPTPP